MRTLTHAELTGNRNRSKSKILGIFRIATTTGSIVRIFCAAAIGLVEAAIVRGHPLGANILVIAFTFGCNEIGIARRALRYAVTHFNILCSGFFRLVIPGISEITGGTAGRASAEGKFHLDRNMI